MNLYVYTNKQGKVFYYVKHSYRDKSGKSTSRIVEKLGTHEELLRLHDDPKAWALEYPVRTVIQFSFEVAFSSFRANRKSRFTQPLAERIEIPFQSKKSCKSALLQSRSLFVRRTVNRLKTGGRRRHLVAAEALAAT